VPRFSRAVLCLLVTVACAAALSAQGQVRYVYDESGRLVGVIDPNGDAAAYHYDAVGNLLGITRSTSTQVAIIDFTPDGGPIGRTVTIYGTGFSATPAQNTVSFNGATAPVTAASTTSLVVNVPPGGTTGAISITSPNGSANSASPFVVAADVAPTISAFNPTTATSGTAITISGTNFHPSPAQNLVTFNASPANITAASSTSITALVPPTSTSGKISVTTPYGTVSSATDFVVPPPLVAAGDIETVYRMSPGSSLPVTFSTPGKVALVLFDAAPGQRVNLNVGTGVWSTVRVFSYDGTQLTSASTGVTPRFIEFPNLTATASYTILVDPLGNGTGSITLTLNAVSPDVTGVIPADGSNYVVPITTAGQDARLTFTAAAGQRVSLRVFPAFGGDVFLYNPDRSLRASIHIGPVFATFIDTQTLTMAGTYTIFVNMGTTGTGNVTLNLYTVPADVTSPITADGPAVTLTTTTPGQNGIATFPGTAGHRMSVWITGISGSSPTVSIRDPGGVALGSVTLGILSGFLEPVTLSTTGQHSILMDPGGAAVGSATLSLYDVPADVTGSLTINGGGTGVSLPGPGQKASYTFSGTASQQVTVTITGNTVGFPNGGLTTVNVKLLRADGTVLTSSTSNGAIFALATQTLPATETYTVLIDPGGAGIGTLTVAVTSP
jgi:YD repeat-containing protein